MLSDKGRDRRRATELQRQLVTEDRSLKLCRTCLNAAMEFEEPPFDRVVYWVREIVREARHDL